MSGNWLVTGGCGFIGVNLVRVLKGRGDYVRVLDNLSVGSRDDLRAVTDFSETGSFNPEPGKVDLLAGDIRDAEIAGESLEGIDYVVHLAAHTGVIPSLEDPRFDCDQNVVGTLNMLLAARDAGVSSFILASSGAPLGDHDPPINELKVPKPLSPYGASKLACEAYCSAFYGSFGLKTVVLRFSNAYGPYSFKKGSVVALFFKGLLTGKPVVIYGDGNQTRDFIHTDDLCQAIIKSTESDVGGEVFQIASGKETTINELVEKIRILVEKDTDKIVKVVYEAPRKGEINRNYADISKAKEMLGYEPKIELAAGLFETIEWFRKASINQ